MAYATTRYAWVVLFRPTPNYLVSISNRIPNDSAVKNKPEKLREVGEILSEIAEFDDELKALEIGLSL